MSCRNFLGAAALSLVAGLATAAPFPERELTGVIMWGAGGAMDVVSRAVTPHAEQALGKKIVLVNKPGGTGAISTNFVNNAPSDGYTLLYGAENPQLHQVLGLADFGYEKFYPVIVLGRGVAVIVVKADAPWNTLKDFVEDAKKRPGKLKMGSTGPGGLPHTVGSMLNSVTKFQVISVPFDGEGPGLTALLGGHVDMMPVGAVPRPRTSRPAASRRWPSSTPRRCRSPDPQHSADHQGLSRSSASTCRGGRSTACSSSATRRTTSRRRWSRRSRPRPTTRSSRR